MINDKVHSVSQKSSVFDSLLVENCTSQHLKKAKVRILVQLRIHLRIETFQVSGNIFFVCAGLEKDFLSHENTYLLRFASD